MLMINTVDVSAASFGRSSSSSSRPSISRSAPSPTKAAPSAPPSQNKVGGIGGTSGSVGVRKPDVTQQAINRNNPPPAQAPGQSYSRPVAPNPNYNTQSSGVTNGSTFVSSLGGAVVGTAIGSMLFGNHNNGGGTTVINNGAPVAGTSASSVAPGSAVDQGGIVPMSSYQPQPYGVWGFIKDVLGFGVLIALIGGIGFILHKLLNKWKNKFSVSHGYIVPDPIDPMGQFWKIQQAFADADIATLGQLIGPAMVNEVNTVTERTKLTITQASYDVLLSNNHEFSVHYTFSDDGQRINQVWHYELIGGTWKLNGLENI